MAKKHLYALLVCVLIVLGAGSIALVTFLNKAEPVMGETGVKLYWNIDRDEYVGDSSAGINSRERSKDGFYKVAFAVDGEQVEYNVEKSRLMHKIDSMDIMGLAIDEEGTITDVFDPEDITGGEIAPMYYVVFASDTNITVCPEEDLEDDYKFLEVTKKTGIYNVTGMDPVGHVDSTVTSDCIRAFQNEEGEITHVFIVERYGYWPGEVTQKYCEHCKETMDWYVWEEKYELPTESGHWLLKNDVKTGVQHKILTDQKVIIDLNGKTITGPTDRRVYAMTGENTFLAFMDSSEEGTGTVIGRGSPDNGGIVLVRYGTLELYGGTLDASQIETLQYGSAIRVNVGAVFNMYNGTVIGGKAIGAMDEKETKTTGGYGGTIQVGGTFNMYDGVVRDGTATRYDKKDGKYTCGNGGNIHLGTGAVFNMYGGEILNGTAQRAGGNIYMGKDAVVNMTGGKISGGVVSDDDRYGGNVYINASGSVFNLVDGTIEKGKTLGAGGNIALYGTLKMSGGVVTGGSCMTGETLATGVHNEEYPHHNIYCAGGTLEMSGGLVEGYLRIRDTSTKECTVKLSGTAKIKGGKINLSLDPGDVVNIGTLQRGADIRINGGGYVSTTTARANTAYVRSTYDGVETKYINNKIFIGKQACVCGETDSHIGNCDGTLLDWIPWGTPTTMPNVAANWYLICDVTMDDQVKIEEKATFRLDLNGHTVTGAEDMRVYALRNGGITMAITDHSAENDGVIMARGKDFGRGACVWVSDNGNLTMYGGTLDGSAVTGLYNGTTVTVDENCKFVMYDGNLKGGKAACLVSATGKSSNGFGGTLAVSGEVDMFGGVISGGYSEKNGGNIFVGKTGSFDMYGGSVLDGEASSRGGNITGTGVINIYGGSVSGGTAGAGGNFYVCGENTSVLGGVISAGTAKHGGNVLVEEGAAWKITGGTITGGVATNSNGGNIESEEGTTIQLSGATVSNGVAPSDGGNIYIRGKLEMANGTISGGNAELGGNVYLDTTATFKMDGGTIEKGTASKHGGAVYATGIFDMNAGKISDSSCTEQGGSIFVGKAATFNLNGGEMLGGTAEKGGNIAGTGKINIIKGLVSGGTAETYGGNIFTGVGLTMDGGEIAGGKVTDADGKGGNIYLEAGLFTLNGGTLTGGNAVNGGSVFINTGATVTMNNGLITGGQTTKTGGNIYVAADNAEGTSAGIFNMNGGTITKGDATQGGNVYLQADSKFSQAAGVLNMNGGIISEGTVDSAGGNVAALGVFTMTGGQISGGKTDATSNHKYGANVYTVPGKQGCSFTMTGGTIAGLVRANNAGEVVISGTAKITNTNGDKNLTLNNATISVGDLAEGASIGVNPDESAAYFATDATADDAKYFTADDGASTVEYEDGGKLKLVKWQDWTSASASGKLPYKAGYYRLAEDMNVSAATTMNKNETVHLDLNGHTVTATKSIRVYVLDNGSVLNITDSSTNQTGKIVGKRTSTAVAGMIYVKGSGAVLNLHQGTLDATNVTLTEDTGCGAAVYVGVDTGKTGAAFNMYGGKIIGGTAKYGGSVYVNTKSTFNMSGGEITGGKATTQGGNIYVNIGAAFNISGGTVTNGSSNSTGGNVYVAADRSTGNNSGVVTMSGGTITLGYAKTQGGNIYLQQGDATYPYGATLNMTGGMISKGTGATAGGNVMALGVLNMSGGEIKGGICNVTGNHKYGANVYTAAGTKGCSFTMTGGKISGWVRVNNAGQFTLGGTAVITDGSDNVITEGNTSHGNSGTCGLEITTSKATLVIDSQNVLAEGAQIALSNYSTDATTKLIVKGTIADIYQGYFTLCGNGGLEFKANDGIYVAE